MTDSTEAPAKAPAKKTAAKKPAAKKAPARKPAAKKAPTTTKAKSVTEPAPVPAVDHLRLWKQGEETPVSATKDPEPGSGQVGTSINGLAMIKRATEMFGPIGIGFGFDIDEERFDDGAPIMQNNTVVCNSSMHTIRVTLWYRDPDSNAVGKVTHFGHTKYVYPIYGGKIKTDWEAPKKSMTDAMKKCLSQVGVFADVYMGMFDDAEYVEAAKVKETIAKAENKAEAVDAAVSEFTQWVAKQCESFAKVPHPASLQRTYKRACESALLKAPSLGLSYDKIERRLYDAYLKHLNTLVDPVDCACDACGTAVKGHHSHHCPECGARNSLKALPPEESTES